MLFISSLTSEKLIHNVLLHLTFGLLYEYHGLFAFPNKRTQCTVCLVVSWELNYLIIEIEAVKKKFNTYQNKFNIVQKLKHLIQRNIQILG